MKTRSSFIHVLLALMLLLSQQLALSHALTHIQRNNAEFSEAARDGKQNLLEAHCELCSSLAQCSDAMPFGALPDTQFSPPDFLTHVGPHCARVAHAAAPYQARAPPN